MRLRWLAVAAALLPAWSAAAEKNPLGMSYLDTPLARVIYFDPLEFLAPHAVQTFTNSLRWQQQRFGWKPSEPVTVLLKDGSDYGNAHALVAPHNRLIFDVSPDSRAFETVLSSERFYSTMNHELVHLVQGDIASEADRRWRRLFGGKVAVHEGNPETLLYNYLTAPRFAAPRWLLEGGAVFMDTWMSGGIGRAQGGYDEMVFRAMVRDTAPFHDPLSLVSRGVRSDFQVGANAYLYGTRFLTWLALEHGPQKVVSWFRRDEGSRRYYADQFEQVFGLPLDTAWQQWVIFEQGFQKRNLEQVRRQPVTEHRELTRRVIGSVSRLVYDEERQVIYAGFRFPGVVEHVGALSTRDGSIRRLADIKRAMLYRVTSFAFDPASRTAFFTQDNLRHRDIVAVNVDSGEQRVLLEDVRIGELVFNPRDRSLMGVRHSRGLASLVRIPHPYREWETVHEFAYETVPSDLDISRDGRLLSATVGTLSGDQFVRVWEIDKVLAGDLKPLSEFRFGPSVPESFVFSPDGRYLYGSSYYTGVSNLFRYEVATGQVVAVSNAEVGYFRPVPLSDGRLLALTYTGEGFVPVTLDPKPLQNLSAVAFLGAEVARRHPVVTTWQVPTPDTVDLQREVIQRGHFRPLNSLGLENAYPVLQGYKDAVGVGVRVNVADRLGFARFSLVAAATPSSSLPPSERGHFEITGEYLGWRGSVSHNKSDFYDLFGPTRRSRKGTAVNLGYDDLLVYDLPRSLTLKYDLRWRGGIDVLPEAQNVFTPYSRLLAGELSLQYSDLRRSLGAVDDEKGVQWSLTGTLTRVAGATVPQLVAEGAWGLQLPLDHSSLWWRGALGAVRGDRLNPVAGLYFGGFGNNVVDSRAVKRYHEWGSLPGFDIDGVSAQRFVRTTVEWNLPPLVFGAAGWPVFHASWLRTSAFATSLLTDRPGASGTVRHASLGLQTDLRFSVLHWSEVTLSAGYAVGYTGGRRRGDEWMISLKIL